MIGVEEYFAKVLHGIKALPVKEIPLDKALGYTLAQTLEAKLPVPPFTNSAMDGFAVHAEDVAEASSERPVTLPVTADIAAGSAPQTPVKRGEAARIMTGAPMPEGANAVVKVEDTNIEAGPRALPRSVTIYSSAKPGKNVRREGGNMNAGDEVLQAGTRVTPQVIAAAASVGYHSLPVFRKPRVAIISTGSELQDPGRKLEPGQIPDSNSIFLAALAQTYGGDVTYRGRSGDDPEHLAEVLHEAGRNADLIITSGGVSQGAFDPVKEVGLKNGFTFEAVRMQPGKPQGFGNLDIDGRSVKVICLPGNPVSVYVSFILFARPLLAVMAGGKAPPLQPVRAIAGASWTSPKGRRQYAPMMAELRADGIVVYPTQSQVSGSHLIASLHKSRGLVVIPAEVDEVNEGDEVAYIPL